MAEGARVDFVADESQRAIADLAAQVLRAPGTDDARTTQALAGPAGYDEALWKSMAQAGLLALALPEGLGGDGFGALAVCSVLREVGRQTLPLPALATLALGVLPTVALGTPEQHRLLAGVADGAILTAALRGMPARREGTTLVLDGAAADVPFAAQAERILVPTEHGVALVPANAAGLSLKRTPTSTGAPACTVRCSGTRVEEVDVLAGDPAVLQRFAAAGAAAVADGVMAAAVELTAEHLRTRKQFGKPLATFQAVAQQIADVYVVARTLNLAATSAAWRLDIGLDAGDDVDVAAYWVGAEVPKALQTCHHLHGGLGVDITYPLHRYYSQAKDLARLVGGASSRLDAIGVRCSSN
jgi:alkylation response protein AidB-like acyl-CoA dehydrogenase